MSSVVFKYDVFGDILFSFTIYTGLSPKILLTACFIFAVLTAGSLRLLLLWISIRLGNAIGTDLSVEVFRKTLYQDYSVHLNRNSSEIVSAIIQKVTITTSVMVAIVGIITTTLLSGVVSYKRSSGARRGRRPRQRGGAGGGAPRPTFIHYYY